MGQRDQATDGWMRTIAPPRDTASVFFHRSPRWSSPSSRPEHDLETCRLSMRPCDQEDTWSETVIASNRFRSRPPAACPSEADGRLCRNARLPDMCERPRQMERPPAAWAALRPSSRCQTARCAAWFRATRLFPATHFCARVGLYPFAPDPKRGGRSADRRTISFVAFARRDWSARVRRGASHDAGRSPLGAPPWRFLAGGRASISGIASGSVQRAPRSQVVVPGGRGPGPPEPAVTSRGRRTPLPASPSGSSLEDAPP